MRSQKVKSVLAGVSSGAASLRQSWTGGNVPGYHKSTTYSVLGDEEFDFDDMVINSAAYRRVFVKQKSRYQLQDPEDIPDKPQIVTPRKPKGPESMTSNEEPASEPSKSREVCLYFTN